MKLITIADCGDCDVVSCKHPEWEKIVLNESPNERNRFIKKKLFVAGHDKRFPCAFDDKWEEFFFRDDLIDGDM